MKKNNPSMGYAKALFNLALAKNTVNDWLTTLLELEILFQKYPSIFSYFSSPLIDPKEKESIFLKALQSSLNPELLHFIQLLFRNRLFEYFLEIVPCFKKLAFSDLGILEGTIVTARAMEPEEKVNLAAVWGKLLNKKVLLKEEVNPTLIGGGILTLQDNYIDFSLKGKLQRLKNDLLMKK